MQQIYGHGGNDELPASFEETLVSMAVAGSPQVVVEGDTTSGDATLSNMNSLAGVAIGAIAQGVGIPAATTVTQLQDAAHTVELSAMATATVPNQNITFTNPPGALAALAGSKVVLVKSAPEVPPKQMTIADLDIADFSGYADSSTVVWSPPLVDGDGNAFVTGDKKQFRATSAATGNSIFGAALVDAGETVLYQYDEFKDADGVPFQVEVDGAGEGLDYVPLFSYKTPAN